MFDKFQFCLIFTVFISGIMIILSANKLKKTRILKKKPGHLFDFERLSDIDRENYITFCYKQGYLQGLVTLSLAIIMLINLFVDIFIIFNLSFLFFIVFTIMSVRKNLSTICDLEKRYIK